MSNILYKVQIGAYKEKANAEKIVAKLKKEGFNAITINDDGFVKVQCGAFANKDNAERYVSKLIKAGYSKPIIVVSKTAEAPNNKETKKLRGAQKILSLMKPYIDSKTAHKDFVSGYNAFIDKYNEERHENHSKVDMTDAWCTEFVELIFYKAGYLNLIGYGKRAKDLYRNAKKNETWKSGTDDIRFGDVVIYKDKDGEPNHTEFALGGNKFISGNYKGGVHYRTRRSLGTVKGRIRPKYPND